MKSLKLKKLDTKTWIIIILVVVILFMLFSNYWGSSSEGFYNNETKYYTGCNPLLYTQSPGCSGCGMRINSCWAEPRLCGVNKACY